MLLDSKAESKEGTLDKQIMLLCLCRLSLLLVVRLSIEFHDFRNYPPKTIATSQQIEQASSY